MARHEHSVWKPSPKRESPLALLRESMRDRLPALRSVKYDRMMVSPFGFFRGAVPVMAADLAAMPHAGIVNQICGDAHVLNLGAYAAPDGRLVFDINDFDETTLGPFEWDVKRLAASLVLAGREAGAKRKNCEEAVMILIASYRKLAHLLARLPVIELAHYQVHRMTHVEPVSAALVKARTATPLMTLEKLTTAQKKGRNRHFKQQPPLLTRLTGAKARGVLGALPAYASTLLAERQHFLAQYRPCDVGFKVVGTGSVGLRDYLVYLEGNGVGDPLFLQIKEEVDSAWAPYVKAKGVARHGGQRVANGQRAMQYLSDPFLGWTTIENRNYLVRQLNDHKAAISLEALEGEGLQQYAELCGELLARGHARSGDAQVLSGYLGDSDKFDEAIAQFAEAYADQTEKDWKLLAGSRRKAPHKKKKTG